MDATPQSNQPSSPNRPYTDQEKRDLSIFTLSQDFPSCLREIKTAIDCQYDERPHKRDPNNMSVSALDPGPLKEDPCKLRNGEMTWCILKSFCPEEGNALQQCMNGDYPGKKTSKIPAQCVLSWRRFDNCMIKKTDEYEAALNRFHSS